MEWQPIETAPKMEVIQLYPDIDGEDVTVGFYSETFKSWLDTVAGAYEIDEKLYSPTHWKPMSEPPKEGES